MSSARIQFSLTPRQFAVVESVIETALNGWQGRRAAIASQALTRMQLAAARSAKPKASRK